MSSKDPTQSKQTNICSGQGTCSAYPCQTCWTPQVCQAQHPTGGDNIGTLIIDVIGILIFFLFLMLQFWFKVATYVVRGIKALHNADRVVQISLAVIALLVFSSLLAHVLLGSRCYSREQQIRRRQLELEIQLKSGTALKGGAAGASKDGAAAAKKPEPPVKALKVALQYPKLYKNVPLNITRVFTMAIFDHKKKKVYETQQEVKIPTGKEHPPLVMAMQPIIVTEYN